MNKHTEAPSQLLRPTRSADAEESISGRLKSVYSATGNSELKAAYGQWAEHFDHDSVLRGARQAQLVGGLVARFVDPHSGPVLDAGAGTGLLGEFLLICGFANIVGIDMSPEMLEIASRKGAYQELQEQTLGEKLKFSDGAFAAVVSAGVFTEGHAPASSFDELIRVSRPGGQIIFSVNSRVMASEFEPKLDELEAAGKWKLRYRTGPHSIMSASGFDGSAFLFVYQVV